MYTDKSTTQQGKKVKMVATDIEIITVYNEMMAFSIRWLHQSDSSISISALVPAPLG